MKTKVEIKYNDVINRDYKGGERGYIDGYITGGDGLPYAVVVIENRVVLVSLYNLKVI